MSAAQTFMFRPVKHGRLSGGLLGFARERVLRHETSSGHSIALLPRNATPDLHMGRGDFLTEEQLRSLRTTHVLTYNRLYTFTDDRGGEYLAVPVAKLSKGGA